MIANIIYKEIIIENEASLIKNNNPNPRKMNTNLISLPFHFMPLNFKLNIGISATSKIDKNRICLLYTSPSPRDRG